METVVLLTLIWAVSGYFTMKAWKSAEDKIAMKYPSLGTPEEQRANHEGGPEDMLPLIFIALGPLGLVCVLIGNAVYFSK